MIKWMPPRIQLWRAIKIAYPMYSHELKARRLHPIILAAQFHAMV